MRRFFWIILVCYIFFTFAGYYPTFGIPPVKRSQIFAAEMTEIAEIIPQSFSKPLILPHPGYISTRFSSYHPGVDIASGLGMPIHPIIDGEVIAVGRDIFGLGNYVVISHEKGFKSTYAHMGKIYVKVGSKVSSENLLGEVGLTGHTSGPHTHLEITFNGQYIDPLKLLPELPEMIAQFIPKKDESISSALKPQIEASQASIPALKI